MLKLFAVQFKFNFPVLGERSTVASCQRGVLGSKVGLLLMHKFTGHSVLGGIVLQLERN